MDAATRETIRRARDAQQRERMARGGLRPIDPGDLLLRAEECDADGYPQIGDRFRRFADFAREMLAEGYTPEQVDDGFYRWIYGLAD